MHRDPNSRYSIEDVIRTLNQLCREQGVDDPPQLPSRGQVRTPTARSRNSSVDSRPAYTNIINLVNVSQPDLSAPPPLSMTDGVMIEADVTENGWVKKPSKKNRRRKKSSKEMLQKGERGVALPAPHPAAGP